MAQLLLAMVNMLITHCHKTTNTKIIFFTCCNYFNEQWSSDKLFKCGNVLKFLNNVIKNK